MTMKKIYLAGLIFALLLFVSCKKEHTPTIPLDNKVDTIAMQLNSGEFINGPYGSVSGKAVVYSINDSLLLSLQNMIISNGPALYVYLSKEMLPVNFIDLGPLQSTKGNQLYVIPGKPVLSQYRYALIHCKQYNHLFGSAALH